MDHENILEIKQEQSLQVQQQIKSLKEELKEKFGVTKIGVLDRMLVMSKRNQAILIF